jgi:KamA family protein
MLAQRDYSRLVELVWKKAPSKEIKQVAHQIQKTLNPHPAEQMQLNVPSMNQLTLEGVQHKYKETVLFFPSQGQTCHSYCTYCFRWAQFVGIKELQFQSNEIKHLVDYLKPRRKVSNVLFTGGDPLIMKTEILRRYIEPLLIPELDHITTIRIGTKATSYWPYRFVTDSDSDELLRLFEKCQKAGKTIAIMAHYSHPRELETSISQVAVQRIRNSGAIIRCQAPLIRKVNDDSSLWRDLWSMQVKLGMIPYYMFIERDTGPKNYFEIPLHKSLEIFQNAYKQVSGLARTVRGPSMSATPGKVVIDGVSHINKEKVFVLKFIQARNPDWVGRPFFAKFDPTATWLSDLCPAFGKQNFFFEETPEPIERALP